MADTSLDHFDEDDLAIIEALKADDDSNPDAANASSQQAATNTGGQGEQGGQQANTGTSDASDSTSANDAAGGAAQQAADANAANEGQDAGNVKAALRAARRSERRARDALERTQRELEELKKRTPEATNTDGELDEALAEDFPQIAAALKKRDEQITRLNEQLNQRQQESGNERDPEFTPPVLPLDVQEVVDEIPELLDLQHNPDQTGWKLAVGFDATLRNHPVWGVKSAEERFAEAARRARKELAGEAPALQQQSANTPSAQEAARAKAEKAVAAAAKRQPETLSDFGGAAAEPEGSNLARFSRMSDDDITNELLRGG